jgi:hypothetical protein
MKDNFSAISHFSPDWSALTQCPAWEAADALKAILRSSETLLEEAETRLVAIRECVFNTRLVAFRIISDRELWKLDLDPDYGVPFKSMSRWLQTMFPKEDGLRYAIEANSTQKALPAASIQDLAAMKRCNAVPLASKFVSDTCRNDREVIEAAKTSTEREFRDTLNKTHGQKLEAPETLKFTYPSGDASQVREFLAWVADKADLAPDDYAGALLYLSINENEDHDEVNPSHS